MCDQGRAEEEDDTFDDVYKKDLITVVGIRAHHKVRRMRINPYPEALLHRGLSKKEVGETANPILEDGMMYTAAMGMELMEGLAIVQDAVDRSALESSERKVEVDRALVRLRHQLGARDDRVVILEDWKRDVTDHMRDIGEAQGAVRGRLREAELHLDQHQALDVATHRELDLLGGVVVRQSEVINIQQNLLLEMEGEFRRKIERLERMADPWGRTLGNPILIEDDPVEDAVVLVEHEWHG